MNEEEWKAFEAHLESIVDPQPDQTKFYHSVLLAHKELKERREDEEWLKETGIHVSVTKSGVIGGGRCIHDCRNQWRYGPTLHAAITAAQGEMKMLKEVKAVREWKDAAGVDSRLFLREVNALVKAVRGDERDRMIRCINDNFVDLPDKWHLGYHKALRDARDWAGSDYDPTIRQK